MTTGTGKFGARLRLALAAGLMVAAVPGAAATYTLIPAYAGAGTTGVLGINDAGVMTGNVTNADNSGSAFVRSAAGVYSLFGVSGDVATLGRAINAAGTVTGYAYADATLALASADEFRRGADGTVTLLHDPVSGDALHGIAQGINATGAIVGENFFTGGGHSYRHGYILNGASFTELSVSADFRVKTVGRGINDAGLVVGWTFDGTAGTTRGFVYSGGSYTFVTDPSPADAATTYLEAVNNNGLASGEWLDAAGGSHAFLYDTLSHAFTELAPPVAGSYDAFGLNDRGEVVITGSNGLNYLYDPAGVPEPAAWLSLTAGFAAIGIASRRSRAPA